MSESTQHSRCTRPAAAPSGADTRPGPLSALEPGSGKPGVHPTPPSRMALWSCDQAPVPLPSGALAVRHQQRPRGRAAPEAPQPGSSQPQPRTASTPDAPCWASAPRLSCSPSLSSRLCSEVSPAGRPRPLLPHVRLFSSPLPALFQGRGLSLAPGPTSRWTVACHVGRAGFPGRSWPQHQPPRLEDLPA